MTELAAMKLFNRLILLISFVLYSYAVLGRDAKPKIESQLPLWVTAVSIPYSSTYLDKDAIDGYSDLHYEQQVSLEAQAVYVKKVYHILSETGVQNLSQLSVEYDPTYQQLNFHSIHVIRNGTIINQLESSRIKTIQQEKELHRNIYDGSLTAFLILEDIRKNDIVEYTYTLKGFNPIFKNKYAEIFSTQYSFPVYSIYYKLIVPQGRTITVKNSLTQIQPVLSASANQTVYEWHIKDQEPQLAEDNIPAWYDAYPMIMVSEFKSWDEISQWAMQLFSFNEPLEAGLKNKIQEIKTAYSSTEERLLAALRFVQDEVRYMGIEMGENSHKPHSPSQVFRQRFGDCKDKSYLLCTMLRQLGLQAYPVFINTDYKKSVAGWLPSPTAFDHTTVCAVVNGKTYWFDPTISQQRGSLDEISYPDYQAGLVIKEGTKGFTKIALRNRGSITTNETFYVKNMTGRAELIVTTKFTGSFADDVRYDFSNRNLKEIQDGYREMYKVYFKKIDSDSLTYEDDKLGAMVVREYYTIRDFWTKEKGRAKVLLEPYLISSILKKPDESERSMPFALTYPANYSEDIEVHLPEDWQITESEHQFTLPACLLNFSYSQVKRDVIRLHYTYESTRDHVLPSETEEYVNELQEAEKIIAFELSDDIDKRAVLNTTINSSPGNLYNIAYVVLGLCAFGTYIYRRQNKKRNYWE